MQNKYCKTCNNIIQHKNKNAKFCDSSCYKNWQKSDVGRNHVRQKTNEIYNKNPQIKMKIRNSVKNKWDNDKDYSQNLINERKQRHEHNAIYQPCKYCKKIIRNSIFCNDICHYSWRSSSEGKKEQSEKLKKAWKNGSFKNAIENGNFKKGYHMNGMNKFEAKCFDILNKIFPDEFQFVGDFKKYIAGKIPDFISTKRKVLVECNGIYWHLQNIGLDDTYDNRRKNTRKKADLYNEEGYNVLTIWEDGKINLDVQGELTEIVDMMQLTSKANFFDWE